MKILYILDYIPLGTRAFDDYLETFMAAVRARGWELRFVFAGEPSASASETLRDQQVPWTVLSFPVSWSFRRDIKRSWPDYRPDLVYTSFLSVFTMPLVIARWQGWMRSWVVSDESSGAPAKGRFCKRVLRSIRGRAVGRVVDGVRAVSHYIAQRDIELMALPKSKVHAVWNGINEARYPFRPYKPDHEELRILYIGQLISEKGVHVLIDALCGLRNSGGCFVCRIAGDGKSREALEAQVQKSDLASHVAFNGFCSDPVSQYHWADVVVIPSIWAEAFGLVAIEAMATGAIVVVSDAGGLPEVVGDAGIVVPAGNCSELDAALTALVKSPERWSDMKVAARRRVEECFSVDHSVASILDLFASVTNTVRN